MMKLNRSILLTLLPVLASAFYFSPDPHACEECVSQGGQRNTCSEYGQDNCTEEERAEIAADQNLITGIWLGVAFLITAFFVHWCCFCYCCKSKWSYYCKICCCKMKRDDIPGPDPTVYNSDGEPEKELDDLGEVTSAKKQSLETARQEALATAE